MIYKIPCAVFIKQDTVENWEKFNPILRDGEIALVKDDDDRFIIIGDGKTSYSKLTKIHLGDSELYLQSRGDHSMRFVITLENHNIGGKTNEKREDDES